jgi:ribosome-associated toxin RatA of RatAB toxin-antitoxin module
VTTRIEKSIVVDVPVGTAYNQWTQFEEFPQFMGGVEEVRQITDRTLHWVAEIGGVKREWEATILEQVPDEKIAWAATQGATNAGAVQFRPLGPSQTEVALTLEYEPEGLVETVGDKLNIVEKRAEADLEKFKSVIESRGTESGAWRGSMGEGTTVGAPGVEAAESSQGDSGKAGVSGKAVAAGAAAAAATVAAASAMKSRSGSDTDEVTEETTEPVVEDVLVIEDAGAGSTLGEEPPAPYPTGTSAPSTSTTTSDEGRVI